MSLNKKSLEKYCMKYGLKREDYALGGPSGGNGGSSVNPFAICHAKVNKKKTAKFERCVMDIKKKEGIK